MSFPRYPSYKDSGVEWLGEVPQQWEVIRIKHALKSMGSGGTPNTSVAAYWSDDETGIPWVAIADMSSHDYVEQTAKRLTSSGMESKGLCIWPAGTLLFSMYASLGHVTELRVAATTNQAILSLVPNERTSQAFLKRWFEFLRPKLVEHASSNTQDNLNAEKVRNLLALRPPMQEQTQIAAFLDRETAKIDDLVAELRRLMEMLKEKRQAVIFHAVTQGLNTHAPMKPSGIEWLGDVPEHWAVSRIANVFREVAEAGTDELPILSVSIHRGVSDKEIDGEDMERKVTRSDDRSKYKQVAPGDLVYNMMRAWQGGFGTVNVAGMVSPAYVVARPKMKLETAYIEHLLRTPQAIEQMRRHSRGVTDFRLRLYWDEFKNIRVPLPPEEEAIAICTKISEMVEKFSAMSAGCEESIALLQERRTALISAAVTGKVDVKEFA